MIYSFGHSPQSEEEELPSLVPRHTADTTVAAWSRVNNLSEIARNILPRDENTTRKAGLVSWKL